MSVRTYERTSVRTYDATNLGQFLSDHFHIAYGTFYRHCECFYRKKNLNRPSPLAPASFFGYFGVFFSETLGHRFQPIWDFPVWIFIFLASLGLSLGVIFCLAQFSFLGPAGTGEILGPKICGERSVCPMGTKLSGFGQYLGRNLMKVENLNFGHGIVHFWYWKPFWDQKIRTSLTLRPLYTNIWIFAH